MPIRFQCDSCGQAVTVDDAHAGRRGQCRRCGTVLTIPLPDAPEDESGYALADPLPIEDPPPIDGPSTTFDPPARSRTAPAKTRPTRRQREEAWKALARRVGLGLAILLVGLGLVAALAPQGMLIVGGLLAVAGIVIFVYGYLSMLYIAYTEDAMYAMLFFLFPPFALWYTVTRMDDLWHRLAIMGVGIAVLTVALWFLKAAQPRKARPAGNGMAWVETAERSWPIAI